MCSLALLLLISSLVIVKGGSNQVYAEEGISTYATTANPTTTLQISNSNLKDIVSPGSTSYVSSNVNITAQDITDYTLVISGPTNLSGTTSITGANGETGSRLSNNTWGYAWSDTNTDDSTLAYSSLSPSGSTLASGKATSLAISKKLTFAAKFSEDAESGHYTANVTLSLAATPREVATGFNGIYDMQDMTAEVCSSATIGQTGSLEDIRDGSIYTVGKLSDGNCWMTRNLRIVNQKLTTADSDISADYTLPNSTSPWSDTESSTNRVYYADNKTNGAYYSWYAATAGTSASLIDNTPATGSICPKGWRLPTITELSNIASSASSWDTSRQGYELSGSFFPAAGYVAQGVLNVEGTAGFYWSSTSSTNARANTISFNRDKIYLDTAHLNYFGNSVRCVARTESPIKTITTMQEMSAGICTDAAVGDSAELVDIRNNASYAVQKLADGNCWMTQELNIRNQTITPNDSDVSSNYVIPASATWSNSSSTPSASLSAVHASGSRTYYTWAAATAGTGISTSADGAIAPDSICPKNWRIPSKAEYEVIATKKTGSWNNSWNLGGVNWYTTGYYDYYANKLGVNLLNTDGIYWSSTASNAVNAYYFYYNSGGLGTAALERIFGYSVRCIAR